MVSFAELFQRTFIDRDLDAWGVLDQGQVDAYLKVRQLPVTALRDLTAGVRDTVEAAKRTFRNLDQGDRACASAVPGSRL